MPASDHSMSRLLTAAQEIAADLVVAGLPDQAVADRLGLARETVNRWRHRNPRFRLALDARRAVMWAGTEERLKSLVAVALDCIEKSIRFGDSDVALAILKAAGLDTGGPTGQADQEAAEPAGLQPTKSDGQSTTPP